jgi:hypothetical protein
MTLYILNESKELDVRGDLQIFSSIDLLVLQIEAIDVRNCEHFAFTSSGRRIFLEAETDYSPIKYTLDEGADYTSIVTKILVSYLEYIVEAGKFRLDLNVLKASQNDLPGLVALIPDELITQT